MVEQTAATDTPRVAIDEEGEYTYEPVVDAVEPVQVSSLVAIIRIVAVLAMGLCVSFGLFIMLVGLKGVIIGVPLVLMAIPCYYGMQFAERLANKAQAASTDD
jgi:hypothetical protein